MNPQKGAPLAGGLPFREGITLNNKPCCRPSVSQVASNVVTFPWIKRSEPYSNIVLQLVTYQTMSAFPVSIDNMNK
jgi:hypothetical protein